MPDGTTDFRANLITVPACGKHNSKYSKDDELAAYTLLLVGGNRISDAQFATKGIRALERRPALLAAMIRRAQRVFVDGRETSAVQIDERRLERVLERVARGLYFHSTGERLTSDVLVVTNFLRMPHLSSAPFARELERLAAEFAPISKFGANPEVFFYQHRDCSKRYALRMCFYESLSVYAIPRASEKRADQANAPESGSAP